VIFSNHISLRLADRLYPGNIQLWFEHEEIIEDKLISNQRRSINIYFCCITETDHVYGIKNTFNI